MPAKAKPTKKPTAAEKAKARLKKQIQTLRNKLQCKDSQIKRLHSVIEEYETALDDAQEDKRVLRLERKSANEAKTKALKQASDDRELWHYYQGACMMGRICTCKNPVRTMETAMQEATAKVQDRIKDLAKQNGELLAENRRLKKECLTDSQRPRR